MFPRSSFLVYVLVYAVYFFAGVLFLVDCRVGEAKDEAAVDLEALFVFDADDFGVAFFADLFGVFRVVLTAGAAVTTFFGVGFFTLVDFLVPELFDADILGCNAATNCPAHPKINAITTTVAAIPRGLEKSPMSVSGTTDIFSFHS